MSSPIQGAKRFHFSLFKMWISWISSVLTCPLLEKHLHAGDSGEEQGLSQATTHCDCAGSLTSLSLSFLLLASEGNSGTCLGVVEGSVS